MKKNKNVPNNVRRRVVGHRQVRRSSIRFGNSARNGFHFPINVALVVALGFGGISLVKNGLKNASVHNLFSDIESSQSVDLLDNIGVVLDSEYGNVDPYHSDFYYLKLDSGNLTEKDLERINYYDNIGIITSLGNNVYDTIDNVKDIISRFNISGAIFCDISDLSKDDYDKVNIFCKKLEANGCYVGLYGDKAALKRLKSHMDGKDGFDYSHYAVMLTGLSVGDETPKVDNYIAYEIDNEIHETFDLNGFINNSTFNKSSQFVSDKVYVVQAGDSLTKIAEDYNISLEDLATFNKLNIDNTIYPGDKIIIPSVYSIESDTQASRKDDIEDYTVKGIGINENVKRIIDVSEHNGHCDWNEIFKLYEAGKLDGVILRFSESYNPDTQQREFYLDKEFEYNLSECNRLGIPYGVYCFSRATNMEQLHGEVNDICNYIDNNLGQVKNNMDLSFHPELPVYMDAFEGDAKGQEALLVPGSDSYDIIFAASLVNEWNRLINERYGFYTGLYSNKNLVKNANLVSLLDREYVRELWLAHYGVVDSRLQLGEHTLSNSDDWKLDEDCSMYQVSEKGYLFNPNDGYIDMNLCAPELFDRVAEYYGRDKTVRR